MYRAWFEPKNGILKLKNAIVFSLIKGNENIMANEITQPVTSAF